MTIELGTLRKVKIREVWPVEPADFTPWLAEHIDLLGDELGLDIDPESLKTVQTEVQVGSYSADIVAEDSSGKKIVIENQYGRTDHDHLGKLLTYAAGVGASTIIWISETIDEPHQKAIEFLNSSTTDDLNLFLVQIEAWRIGDSMPAPKFNVVERPNEWSRTVKGASSSSAASDSLAMFKFEFWRKVREIGVTRHSSIHWLNPYKEHWQLLPSVKRKFAEVVMAVGSKGHSEYGDSVLVSYQFWPKENGKASPDKTLFDALETHRVEIEHALGMDLEWIRGDGKGYSAVRAVKPGDYRDESQHDELAIWLVDTAAKFFQVFPKYDTAQRT